mmetsp:Transcript_59435/g.158038  ORF Transcript_59435/g.158038 Transcript_59435/m.158038 type:complete len:202 (+) Transcript_59435:702-1307(+)
MPSNVQHHLRLASGQSAPAECGLPLRLDEMPFETKLSHTSWLDMSAFALAATNSAWLSPPSPSESAPISTCSASGASSPCCLHSSRSVQLTTPSPSWSTTSQATSAAATPITASGSQSALGAAPRSLSAATKPSRSRGPEARPATSAWRAVRSSSPETSSSSSTSARVHAAVAMEVLARSMQLVELGGKARPCFDRAATNS